MSKLNKRINLAVNLAIVLVVVLLGIAIAKKYLPSSSSNNENRDYRVTAGSKPAVPDVDWRNNGETLLLVLDRGCSFCTASAPFYQQLTREAAQHRGVQLVAVLPQSVSEGKQYLSDLNVPIDQVRQSSLDALGVKGTPTLVLVNSRGEVEQSWAGKLAPDQETEVLKHITKN